LILLDTHVIVWLALEETRISARAQAAISEARRSVRGLAISDFTLFELRLLLRKKQFVLTVEPETFLIGVERRFVVLPITANIALQAFELPKGYPNDPADRIIGATALIEDIPLLTADREIRKSRAVATIW
jgi:PIN domain nuclease of toxin-antitoxin system